MSEPMTAGEVEVIIMPPSEPPSALIDKDCHSKFHGSHVAHALCRRIGRLRLCELFTANV